MDIFDSLDDIDLAILGILQERGRLSHTDLAREINLSQSAVYKRIKRLEELGAIEQYVAILNRDRLGFDMLCFLHINIQAHSYRHINEFKEAVIQLPEVLECHHITGSYDYLLKVILRNRKELERFAVDRITTLPGVSQVQTSIVLSKVKSTTAIVLD